MMNKMNSRGFAVSIMLPASLVFSCTGSGDTNEEFSRPNFIYILADDLGYGDLGCYGQRYIETPNIDRMAAQGMLFTSHYSGSTVCAPSRSSLMTGLHTGHTQIRGNRRIQPEGQFPLPAGTVTLPKVLKEAGYVTGAFGKWGLGYPGSEGDPVNQGFDVFFGYNCQGYAHRYYPEYIWHNENKYYLEGNDWTNKVTYAPDVIHSKTLDFITENSDTSFFLFVPSILPHAEMIVPDDDILERYRGQFDEIPWKGNDYGSENFLVSGYCSQNEPFATHAAMISRLDRQVGEIMQLIISLGIAENTFIIFTSDNGPHSEGGADPDFFNSNSMFRGSKRDLYEGGIRVPFIAWWPGTIKASSTSDHVSAFWDMMPTLSELAGIKIANDTDGVSMVPELSGKGSQKQHDYLYWEFHEQGGKQAVRMGKWKGIRLNMADDPDASIELYDLSIDQGEKDNVSALYPEIIDRVDSIMQSARIINADYTFAFER